MTDDIVEHSSLANIASDWIAQRILDGSIAPGQKIAEVWVGEKLGISRSPVREALRVLSRDGLVVIEPRRGARVGELDRKHADDLYTCRLMIEPPSIRLAVRALDDFSRSELNRLFTRMQTVADDNDAIGYVSALQQYSLKTLHLCPNRILVDLAEITWRGSLRYWNLLVRGRADYITQSLDRNGRIHEAVLGGDADEAERSAAQLLTASRDELRLLMAKLT